MDTHSYMEQHYLEEDIDYVAKELGVELTEQEVAKVIHDYYKLEDETMTDLRWLIQDIKKGEE